MLWCAIIYSPVFQFSLNPLILSMIIHWHLRAFWGHLEHILGPKLGTSWGHLLVTAYSGSTKVGWRTCLVTRWLDQTRSHKYHQLLNLHLQHLRTPLLAYRIRISISICLIFLLISLSCCCCCCCLIFLLI